MKRFTSILIVITFVLNFLYFSDASAYAGTLTSGECGDNVYYTVTDDGEIIIEGNGSMYDYGYDESPFYNMLLGEEYIGGENSGNIDINTITIKSGVTHIGDNAFYSGDCEGDNFLYFNIASTVKSVGKGAFCGVKAYELTLPSSVTTIPKECFYVAEIAGTLNLKGAKKVNSLAFSGATIGTLALPKNLSSISDNAFWSFAEFNTEQSGIKTIKVSPKNKYFSSKNGALYNKSKSKLIYYPSAKTSFKIAKGVKKIAPYAFNGSRLKRITLPATVTSIGKYAFYNSAIEQISIPGKVNKIPDECFENCYNLNKVSIPNSVVEIGSNAFFWSSLQDVDIPNSVKTIKNAAIGINGFFENGKGITVPASVKKMEDGAINCDEAGEPMIGFIAGYKGTAAEKYAKKHKIKFVIAPAKGKILQATSPRRGKMSLKWKKVSKAKGYQVKISTSSTMCANTKQATFSNANKVSTKVSNLKKGRTYYVTVRAYTTKRINGKAQRVYGSWSKIKKVRIRK